MKTYAELRKINVNDHVEKKGNLSYLSWAWAVDTLLTHDPMATWSFAEPKYFGETVMVFCTVNALGKSMTMHLPVMDHKNNALKNPDARKISDAMMRCLAKCIATFGIGLYIYAGEDLPQDVDYEPSEDVLAAVDAINSAEDVESLQAHYKAAYKLFQKDANALKLIINAKDSKKHELATR